MCHSYRTRTFEGLPEQVAEVREFVHWAVGDLVDGVDDVVLVASELAGNAIRHSLSGSPGGSFVLELAEFQDAWHVRVTDQGGSSNPASGPAAEADEAGRGLLIVIAVARAGGVIGDSTGRTVWAEIPYPKDDIATQVYEGGVMLVGMERIALSLESLESATQVRPL